MIIVTGGAGFIGTNLVRSLIESDKQILIIEELDRYTKTSNIFVFTARPVINWQVSKCNTLAICGLCCIRVYSVLSIVCIVCRDLLLLAKALLVGEGEP